MQRRDRRDQIHAELLRVDQRASRLQMQRSIAAGGDPLNEEVRTRLACVHRAQQPTVVNTRGTFEHAARIGWAADDVGWGAPSFCPRRRRRQNDVDDERAEAQRDKAPDKRCPIAAVAQPKHSGDHIGQDEKRHVDAADDHFPPRRLRHLDALLQPHRRDGPEEQPPVGLRLKVPQRRRAEQRCRSPAQVIEQQKKRERQPIADDCEYLATPTDARGDQPGGDVEQHQFAIEGEPLGHGSVDHDNSPGGDRQPARIGKPTATGLARRYVNAHDRVVSSTARRPPWCIAIADSPGRQVSVGLGAARAPLMRFGGRRVVRWC